MQKQVVLAVIASSIFGGMVGAFATAATQSSAAPQLAALSTYQNQVEVLLQAICLNTLEIAVNGGSTVTVAGGHNPVFPEGCISRHLLFPIH